MCLGGRTRSGRSWQGRLSLIYTYTTYLYYSYGYTLYGERGSKYPPSITHERVIIIILTVHQLCATPPSAQHHRNRRRDHRRTRFFFFYKLFYSHTPYGKQCNRRRRRRRWLWRRRRKKGYTAATTARQASCSGRFGAGRVRSPSQSPPLPPRRRYHSSALGVHVRRNSDTAAVVRSAITRTHRDIFTFYTLNTPP